MATAILYGERERQRAIEWIKTAPPLATVTVKANKRSIPQNDRVHAMLTDLAAQRLHHGQRLSLTTWKRLFAAAMKREVQLVPNLTDDGFVMIGEKTSEMSREECSDMIELMYAYGAQWGIVWTEPTTLSSAAKDRGAGRSAPRLAAA